MSRRNYHLTSYIYVTLWLAIAIPPLVSGWSFYTTPISLRMHQPDYNLFRSSGLIGQGLGVIGSLMIIVGVASYSLRKRAASLHRSGKLRSWLSFHIFLCSLGPFLILLHTTFNFTGIIAIAFWSMVIVVASGVFGRYVYVRIPKTTDGHFLNVQQLQEERVQLIASLNSLVPESAILLSSLNIRVNVPRITRPSQALTWALAQDIHHINQHRRWTHMTSHLQLTPMQAEQSEVLVRRLRRNTQQIALMLPFQKLFTYWHVMHVPLAMVMFIILVIHIAVAFAFGYFWIFGS